MAHHVLKTWPEYLDAIGREEKLFEVRKNDRNFQVGDTLELRGYDPKTDSILPYWIRCKISYILEGGQFGIEPGYVVMQLKLPANHVWRFNLSRNPETTNPDS